MLMAVKHNLVVHLYLHFWILYSNTHALITDLSSILSNPLNLPIVISLGIIKLSTRRKFV